MAGMKLAELEFLRLLPSFMRDDEAVIALSKAVNELIGEPSKRIPSIRVWDQIDNLSESECDEMAWEQDVDWYDSTGMSLEEKRETIKLAQQIKRKRGTKWAVERLISVYFGEGFILEWYEMEKDPFTFIVLTTNTAITLEDYAKFIEAVRSAQNERSHIAGIYYFWQQGPDPGIEYAMGCASHKYDFRKTGTYPRTATIGAIVKNSVETEPETNLHKYGFEKTGDLTCGTYPRTATIGAIVKNSVETEPETNLHKYGFEKTGDLTCGTYPRISTKGAAVKGTIETASADEAITYGFERQAGTYPRPGTNGAVVKGKVEEAGADKALAYRFERQAGTYPNAGTLGALETNKAATAPEISCTAYAFTKCGTRRCGE